MSEKDPTIRLDIGGEQHELTRDNTHLYRFMGEMAVYNHIYMMLQDGEEVRGMYMFQGSFIGIEDSPYTELSHQIITQEFPMHLNQQEPADCDIEAFNRQFLSDIQTTDTFPDDWN